MTATLLCVLYHIHQSLRLVFFISSESFLVNLLLFSLPLADTSLTENLLDPAAPDTAIRRFKPL
jgi:hypothetical protein